MPPMDFAMTTISGTIPPRSNENLFCRYPDNNLDLDISRINSMSALVPVGPGNRIAISYLPEYSDTFFLKVVLLCAQMCCESLTIHCQLIKQTSFIIIF